MPGKGVIWLRLGATEMVAGPTGGARLCFEAGWEVSSEAWEDAADLLGQH